MNTKYPRPYSQFLIQFYFATIPKIGVNKNVSYMRILKSTNTRGIMLDQILMSFYAVPSHVDHTCHFLHTHANPMDTRQSSSARFMSPLMTKCYRQSSMNIYPTQDQSRSSPEIIIKRNSENRQSPLLWRGLDTLVDFPSEVLHNNLKTFSCPICFRLLLSNRVDNILILIYKCWMSMLTNNFSS